MIPGTAIIIHGQVLHKSEKNTSIKFILIVSQKVKTQNGVLKIGE